MKLLLNLFKIVKTFFKWINLDYYHFLIKKQNNSNSVIVKNKKNKKHIFCY